MTDEIKPGRELIDGEIEERISSVQMNKLISSTAREYIVKGLREAQVYIRNRGKT